MLPGLHAFADDSDVERVADVDDRPHQLCLLGTFGHRSNERPVDLEPGRIEVEQADDRGMPGAEIVNLDFDAEVAES
ncbi:hypothetical protein D3C87_2038050 [compost metagenome]